MMKKNNKKDIHAEAYEAAMEVDREYFKTHQDATSYTRAPMSNEFPPQVYEEGEVLEVTVYQVSPGLRARSPLQRIKVRCEG